MKKVKIILIAMCCLLMAGNYAYAEMSASITSPHQGGAVTHSVRIDGTCNDVPGNRYLWAVVQPEASPMYHPQSDKPDHGSLSKGCSNGAWSGLAFFGVGPQHNIGERFTLMIVAVDGNGNKKMQGYLKQSNKNKSYPGLTELPAGAKVLHQITVRRR